MRVLNVPFGADTGGISHQLELAFESVPEVEFRSLITTVNYLEYPRSHEYSIGLLRAWWKWADVLHLHHDAGRAQRVMQRYNLPPKPAVLHFHGTGFRENPQGFLRRARKMGALPLVSTIDLWALAPDQVRWAPSPIEDLGRYRKPANGEKLRVVHAPTNRAIKGSQAVIEACRAIPGVELDLIERVPWDECLERKGQADIVVDQFELGYGMNAVEAWSMGIPVIAGARYPILKAMERVLGEGCLPFVYSDELSLLDTLLMLEKSDDLREAYGALGREYVRAYHGAPSVFVEAYREVSSRG